MTPAEIQKLLDEGVTLLKQTTVGYAGHSLAWQQNQTTKWWQGLDKIAQARKALEPTSPASPAFGADLPPRLAQSPGPVVEASTLEQLRQVYAAAALGSIIRVTEPIDMGGSDLVVSRQASAAQPLTLTGTAPIRNGRILVRGASYTRLQLASSDSPSNGYKITGGSHHIEIDLEGRRIERSHFSGILQTDPACHDWQIWNARIWDCGTTTNLDHGMYLAAVRGACVVANAEILDSQAYGIQVYPDSDGLLITCVTVRGGRTRGGIMLGTESQATRNITVVGAVIGGSKVAAVATHPSGYVVAGGRAFDCVEYGNVDGFMPGMVYENCVHADPVVAAAGHVRPERFGLVPLRDIDAMRRETGDAGCYSARAA